MLQQTRVAAVLPYYDRFLARFPDIPALARASEQELLACWSGLGYYSRARNLQRAARLAESKGGFPRDYADIRGLPGVGDYTAAAIASIAFGLPYAVLDGNVIRVLARLFNESGDVRSAVTRKRLQGHADRLLDRARPGEFNQAVMELGATVCLPRDPQCLLCPVADLCEARRHGAERTLPRKSGNPKSVRIQKTLLLIERGGSLLLWQRPPGSGRMEGFWELPEPDQLPGVEQGRETANFRHTIMNCSYCFTVARAAIRSAPSGFSWVSRDRLPSLPLSTAARKALAKNL
jgi:A/G-specific adenine glycosylase